MVESGFDTGARSRVGAGGIWQFMPGAARAYGLEVSYWLDARRDPERAADAAARYLKDLYVRFGSWPLVFAAYNAGYGAVLKSITAYNTNDYWELSVTSRACPGSRASTCRRSGGGHRGAQPGGVRVRRRHARRRLRLRDGRGARRDGARDHRARRGGASRDPRGAEPGDLCATARRPIAARRGAAAPRHGAGFRRGIRGRAGAAIAWRRSSLRFGETLDDVARAHGTSARELRRLNGVKDTSELRAGIGIVVPHGAARPRQGRKGGDKAEAAARTAARRRAATARPRPPTTTIPGGRARSVFTYEGRERVFYRTRDGDGSRRWPTRSACAPTSWSSGTTSIRRQAAPAHGAADLRAQGLRSRRHGAAGCWQGAGRDPRLGGVPRAGDGAAREEVASSWRRSRGTRWRRSGGATG